MSQDAKKETQAILREMRKRGFKVGQQKRGGHYTIEDPETGRKVTVAATPSDPRMVGHVRADIKRDLGIDLRQKPRRKKGTSDDWAMQRLRDRALKQMERGATQADLARGAILANQEKHIGGWTDFNSASVGIANLLKGGRLMKPNHDTLAAGLSKLESAAEPHIFERHLNEAAERMGQKRIAGHTKPDLLDELKSHTLEPEPEEGSIVSPAGIEPEPEAADDPLPTGSAPQGTLTIRIEIDRETRIWLQNLIHGIGVKVMVDDE